MDIRNNDRGLILYEEYIWEWMQDPYTASLSNNVQDAIIRGELWYINDEGVIVPTNR